MSWEVGPRLVRHRSTSRYQQSHDIMVSYRDTTHPVDKHILDTYLPGLARQNLIRHGELNLNALLSNNNQLLGPSRYPWYHAVMLDTLDTLLTSLSFNVDRSESTNLELATFLEQPLHGADHTYIARHGGHTLTYQRFYCLAKIAALARSERIQSVLTHFFTKFGGDIVEDEESPYAVYEWCEVIIRTFFKPSDRVGCLREIVLRRPQVLEELYLVHRERPCQDTRQVLVIVGDVVERIYGASAGKRGRWTQRRVAGWPARQRYHSDSPPRQRIAARLNPLLPPPVYSEGLVVPRGLYGLPPRRAHSQRPDHSRINRMEARVDGLEHELLRVVREQNRLEWADRSASDIWSDSEDSPF